ncbi:hypothetical protein PRUPE_5G169200 [Prunus persica]|uniref:Uncharacterized protein n=1 Tax=Prunus persica TaxID=3760 RepID=A0A251P9S2_PRUPE|nr:hypothetical protein PRUPE_5G169200 [Prunus persica]
MPTPSIDTLSRESLDGEYEGDNPFHYCAPLCESSEERHGYSHCVFEGNSKVEETAPGVATGMILSLHETLQNCKDTLATCQVCICCSTFSSDIEI